MQNESSNSDISITVKQLQSLFELVIRKLKSDGHSTIHIDADWYWEIYGEDSFNFTESPDVCVGSLNDDLTYLLKMLEEKDMFSYTGLDKIAAVLKAISNVATK